MNLNEMYHHVESDHRKLIKNALEEVVVKDCFKIYVFFVHQNEYHLKFNLITLDFITLKKMPVQLRAKIKAHFINSNLLKWKFKKEARAFFDFLKLYYIDSSKVVFTDCESPDFILHEKGNHGYEVTEATDAHNAMFNETIYLVKGMDQNSKEFRVFIKQLEIELTNKKSEMKQHYYEYNRSVLYADIVKCIEKKALKYQEYKVDLDTKNIIIFNNRIGFRRKEDFEKIQLGIMGNQLIKNSEINRIFIVSGTHDVMAEFSVSGELISVTRKKF